MILVGCSTKGVPLPEEQMAEAEKAKKNEPTTRTITSGGGSLDGYDIVDGKRAKVWTVAFDSAALDYSTNQQFGGSMKGVRGTVYDEGKTASTFVASEAVADKGSSVLKLVGGVTITATSPRRAKLFCGEIVYNGAKGQYEARQGIELTEPSYVMTGLEHVIANADLTVVATPDMFEIKK